MEGLSLDFIFREIASKLYQCYKHKPGHIRKYEIALTTKSLFNKYEINFELCEERKGELEGSKFIINILKSLQDYEYSSYFGEDKEAGKSFEGGRIYINYKKFFSIDKHGYLILDIFVRPRLSLNCYYKDETCSMNFKESFYCECLAICSEHVKEYPSCPLCDNDDKIQKQKKREREEEKE